MNLKVMDQYGIQQTNPSFIGHINPFRYRGYYYDNETGFYYLQTRYYDPTICRFINADNYELVAQLSSVAGQLNLYAYANNNPIMLTDESGEGILAAIIVGALIGAAVGATTYTASEIISYTVTGEWTWSWGEFVGSTIGGGIGGALVPIVPNVVAVGIGGFSSSAISMGFQNLWEDTNYSFETILFGSSINAVTSMIGYGVMKLIKISKLNSGQGSFSAVSDQIITKLKRNIISKVSIKTLSKMYIVDLYNSGLDILQGLYGG